MNATTQPRERADRISRPASRARTADHISGPPHSAHNRVFATDRHGGYSFTSIVWFWLGVPAVGALLIIATLGADRAYVILNLALSVPMIIYAARRMVRGFPRAPDQHLALSALARLATLAILVALIALGVSAPLMVLADAGFASSIGIALPQQSSGIWPVIGAIARAVNDGALTGLTVAVAIQLLMAVSYAARGMTNVLLRMRHPVKGGH